MDKFLQQWNEWDIQRRRYFLSNLTLSLFTIGIAVPIIIGLIAAALESPMLMTFGAAAGLSTELLMINAYIWKDWIATL